MITEVVSIDFEKNEIVVDHYAAGRSVFLQLNDIILMQYTGLKDKNGVEIYEGDICEWHIPDMSRPEPDAMVQYVSAVEYRNGSFNLSGYLFSNVRLIKVLSNIYENPELLEVAE